MSDKTAMNLLIENLITLRECTDIQNPMVKSVVEETMDVVIGLTKQHLIIEQNQLLEEHIKGRVEILKQRIYTQ